MDSQPPQQEDVSAAAFPKFIPRPLAAALLIALVLALELYGIRWGLPSTRNIESFHPDEWTVVEAARRVAPLVGQVNPGFYNYGSLYIFALSFAFSLTGQQDAGGALDPAQKALLYLTARLVTVLFSLGTVLLTWRLGARLFGERPGQLSAALLAVTPLWVI
ncbi:MAG: glycosyltransferase family 39 protein, partial [Armatimonadota bacterium]|nr:glycosyltransferase family 39 protein [Armatimonadota bacterium]